MSLAPRSLRSNVIWTLVSNVVYGAYQWLLLVILAKWGGAESVGEFSLALGFVVPIQMFFNLQLRALLASDAKSQFEFSVYFWLRVTGIALTVLFSLVLTSVGVFPAAIVPVLVGVLAIKALESLSDIVYGLFQKRERLDLSSKSKLAEAISGLVIFGIVYPVSLDLQLSLISVAMGLIAVFLFITVTSIRKILPRSLATLRNFPDRSSLTQLAGLGLPLGITMGLSNFSSAAPRFVLERFGETSQVGVYAALMQLVTSGVIVTGAVGQAVTPRLSSLFATGEVPKFRSLLNKLLLAGICVGLTGSGVSFLFGKEILTLIYSDEFSSNHSVLVIIAAGSTMLFAASFQGYALTAARVLRGQLIVLLCTLFVSVSCLILLVPEYGLTGAAWSSVFAALTQFVTSAILIRMRLREVSVVEDGE